MKLSCIIVDDEQAARNGLAADIKEIDFLQIMALTANVPETLDKIKEYSPDLIFLDIEMPGLSGIDFLNQIRVKPMVIITTAYPQFALEGFDHGVVDYLLKPVSQQRLRLACDKAYAQYPLHRQSDTQHNSADYCYLKCDGKFEKIPFDTILYIEAANNYILVHTKSRRFLTYSSLKNITGLLPVNKFVRVHKSFIVAKDHITQISGNEIGIGQVSIPLSRNFKTAFHQEVIKPNWRSR
jgi:DNA-binding LytR/AlgR family response regulator